MLVTPQEIVLDDVITERLRQEELNKEGKFSHTCADAAPDTEKLAILAEEFGEVAKEVCERLNRPADRFALYTELIQTAAVCVAWCERLQEEKP